MNAIKNMNTLHAIEPATTSRANVDELAAKEAQAAPRRSPAFSETQTRAVGVLSTSASSSQPERPPPHPMTPSERSLQPSTSASGYLASSLTLTASFIPRSASLNFPGPSIAAASSAAAARVAAGSGSSGPQNASAVGLLFCFSARQPISVSTDDVFVGFDAPPSSLCLHPYYPFHSRAAVDCRGDEYGCDFGGKNTRFLGRRVAARGYRYDHARTPCENEKRRRCCRSFYRGRIRESAAVPACNFCACFCVCGRVDGGIDIGAGRRVL